MPCLLASIAAAAAAALSGCGAPAGVAAGTRDPDAERFLLETLTRSTSVRYTHLRCFAVRGPWSDACTFQVVSPRQGQDDPLLVMGLQFDEGHPISSTGTAPLDIACANHLRCWVRTLCAATRKCPVGSGAFGTDPSDVVRLRTPTPSPMRCVSAWNAHGRFSPAEVAQETPLLASAAVARPIYTPHLSGASLGFIGRRAEVRAVPRRCFVLFETGTQDLYEVAADARGESRFWIWQGADDLTSKTSVDPSWNACQREDGTLFLAESCPAVAAAPRPVRDELERGYLQQLSDAGGIPYWLGRTFEGARPVPVDARGAESAVLYAKEGPDGRNLLVLTYRPPDRGRRTRGVLVARAEPEDATVLVVADRKVSPALRRAVLHALRPYVSTEPDAEQVPGDLREEPTRIDTSAPLARYWVGPSFEGFEAAVVADAPAGAAVVRYAKGNIEWFLASYVPRPKKRCPQIGCVSPPPLPADLRQYGDVVDTTLFDQRVVVTLAKRPKKVPYGAHVYEHLELLR